jgi:hypothetical protein
VFEDPRLIGCVESFLGSKALGDKLEPFLYEDVLELDGKDDYR